MQRGDCARDLQVGLDETGEKLKERAALPGRPGLLLRIELKTRAVDRVTHGDPLGRATVLETVI
jgi:hypothetical protein